MFDYSVITPATDPGSVFYIVPLAEEERFVAIDCDSSKYTFARLDKMLEILNGYQEMRPEQAAYETEHYHYSRDTPDKSMLAIVTARKQKG